jgi:hypothetical protein
MFKWITKSRFRTAVAVLAFFSVFLVSASVTAIGYFSSARPLASAPPSVEEEGHAGGRSGGHVGGGGGGGGPQGLGSTYSALNIVAPITTLIAALGTISTMILAWRTDRRTAKESDLKIIQMQQQISELQSKLMASPPDHPQP